MNRQPFATPPQSWEPKMTPWFARAWFPMVRREMRNKADIQNVDLHGLEHLQSAVATGAGVLITPNHSFHYDSYVLGHAAHEVARPFHVMAAWQVFHAATSFQRFIMQRNGIFSIDRESADLGAFKRAVEILRSHHCPLVIFPEGTFTTRTTASVRFAKEPPPSRCRPRNEVTGQPSSFPPQSSAAM